MIWWIVVRAPAVPGPLLSPGAALSVSILGSPSLSHWEIQQRRPRPLAVFGNHRGLKESKKKKEVAALITQFGSSRAQRASEREREREKSITWLMFSNEKEKKKREERERERESLYIFYTTIVISIMTSVSMRIFFLSVLMMMMGRHEGWWWQPSAAADG